MQNFLQTEGVKRDLAVAEFIPLMVVPPFIAVVFLVYCVWRKYFRKKHSKYEADNHENAQDIVVNRYGFGLIPVIYIYYG